MKWTNSYRSFGLKTKRSTGLKTIEHKQKTGPWTSGPFYSALAAQRKADRRRRESRKPRRMDSGPLRAWVLDALRRGWSPELIEGRLKAQCAGDPSMRISHECLYQWIYAKPQRALDLRQYLARGRKRRTRKKGRKAKGPRIPMRAPIADRPEAVGSRKGFGHFESDTVVGAAPSRRCMNTQVERRSRRLFARLVDDKSASAIDAYTARMTYGFSQTSAAGQAPVEIGRAHV